MGFTKRKLATPKDLSDKDLIRGYILGTHSRDEIDERNTFFSLAMTSPSTELGTLAAAIWQDAGPRALRRHHDTLPPNLMEMIGAHGWPLGDFTEQEKTFHRTREQRRQDLIAIATKHRRKTP